jgi:hypothetical protein
MKLSDKIWVFGFAPLALWTSLSLGGYLVFNGHLGMGWAITVNALVSTMLAVYVRLIIKK